MTIFAGGADCRSTDRTARSNQVVRSGNDGMTTVTSPLVIIQEMVRYRNPAVVPVVDPVRQNIYQPASPAGSCAAEPVPLIIGSYSIDTPTRSAMMNWFQSPNISVMDAVPDAAE